MTMLRIDEINRLNTAHTSELNAKWGIIPRHELARRKEEIWDDIYLYLLWRYLTGENNQQPAELSDIELSDIKNREIWTSALNKEIEGKTAQDRVLSYAEAGEWAPILRVAETDGNRLMNAGIYASATGKKTWHTMMDDKVRDTHDYLEGVTVDKDEAFYTYDGDYAMYPGDFALPQNNVNCRCYITTE